MLTQGKNQQLHPQKWGCSSSGAPITAPHTTITSLLTGFLYKPAKTCTLQENSECLEGHESQGRALQAANQGGSSLVAALTVASASACGCG